MFLPLMRKSINIFLSTIVVVVLITACGGPGGEEVKENFKAGLAGPFSGTTAFVGENILRGVQLSVDQINADGGVAGRSVELFTADTEGNPQGAAAAITQLTTVDNVHVQVGPTSITIMSVLDRIQAGGVPTDIIGSTSALDDTIKGETTFRANHSDTVFGPAMAWVAVDLGYKECAMVMEALEGAQALKGSIPPAFESLGGVMLREIDIAPGQTSYRSEMLQLLGDPVPDCVFVELSPESAAQFWQNASEFDNLGDVVFVATDFALSEDALDAMQPAMDNLQMIAVSVTALGPGRDEFRNGYLAKYTEDTEPVVLSDLGWDAMNLLALAAHKAGSLDHAEIAANVRSVSGPPGETCISYSECRQLLDDGKEINYEGAVGSCDIDERGNSTSGFGIFELIDGAFESSGELSEQALQEVLQDLNR